MSSAYNILCDIESRSKSFAQDLPRQEIKARLWVGIGFALAEYHFVVPLDEVIEVLPCPKLYEAPGTVSWIAGIANIRGLIVPVTDLEQFVSGNRIDPSKDHRIFVVRHQRSLLGLMVQQTLGLQRFDVGAMSKQIHMDDENYKSYVSGEFILGKEMWFIFSFKQVLESEMFYKISVR